MNIFENSNVDTILGIIGTIIGIIGLISAYIFYRLGLRIKGPKWTMKTNNLIQDNVAKLSGLEIAYGKQRVKNLTVSKVVIWNDGKETIMRNDLAKVNPLRIIGQEDVKILGGEIIAKSSSSNKVSIDFKSRGNQILINFDYLDHKQGLVIQVVHTGIQHIPLNVVGDIKGAKAIQQLKQSKIDWNWIIGIVALIGLFAVAIFPNLSYSTLTWMIFILGILINVFIDIKLFRDKFPAYPKEFADFVE